MRIKLPPSIKKKIVWIPIMILLINAGFRILYWEQINGGCGYAGGGFGPFCSPMYKNVLVVKIKVDNDFFLYKGNPGIPIKNIMHPSKGVIDEIGRRILDENIFRIKMYPKPIGNLTGEIYGEIKESIRDMEATSTLSNRIINRQEINFVQLNLWELDDDPNVFKGKTRFLLNKSYEHK